MNTARDAASYAVTVSDGAPLNEPRHTTTTGRDTRNIVVTGFMGTGKTTVGRVLATRLGFEFVDTDAVIEGRHGPITAIFAERGEVAFREFEREVARELAERDQLVIATGGGMMLDPENVALLSRNGRVFCLVATPEAILGRVNADTSRVERPLLATPDPLQRIVDLLAERHSQYDTFTQVSTESRTPDAIVDDLIALTQPDT